MVREPAVAGQFYPGSAARLSTEIGKLLSPQAEKQKALLAVIPHAAYIYSGVVVGEVLSRIEIPRRVMVVGPNHRGMGHPAAVMSSGHWETPLGLVKLDAEFGALLKKQSTLLGEDEAAHRYEHSLEVQVPFLQTLRGDLLLTPLCLSFLDLKQCLDLGAAVARAIEELGEPVLLVASTDMSHYETAESAAKRDQMAIERVLALDPRGLFNTVRGKGITMCGVLPTTVLLNAALQLGAQKAELVRYTHSGVASGDYQQVVGYAGVIVS